MANMSLGSVTFAKNPSNMTLLRKDKEAAMSRPMMILPCSVGERTLWAR